MADNENVCTGRVGILNLISQRERGFLLNSYKSNVTHVKVSQLPKSPDRSKIFSDVEAGFNFNSLRSGPRGHIIGEGEHCNGITRSQSSLCVFRFLEHNSVGNDASINNPPVTYRVSANHFFSDMYFVDTADLSYYSNPKSLLIAGNFYSGTGIAILASFRCDSVSENPSWRVDNSIFCCAGEINSGNFVLGCYDCFYVCKNLKLSKKYDLRARILATEFSDSNSFFISNLTNGIQHFDLRENTEISLQNSSQYIKEPVLSDRQFLATRMKLLSDKVTLIALDKTGHIHKIDLRMRRPVFQYPEHRSSNLGIPLNIDEDLDLLCAVGDDYYCSIWSLSSGKKHWAHKFAPTKYRGKPKQAHACIVSSGRCWFLAVVQNETLTPIYPDTDNRNDDRFWVWDNAARVAGFSIGN